MEQIDPSSAEHREAVAKIKDLARWPHHCQTTRTAEADMIRFGISKGLVLDAILEHLARHKPIFALKQRTTGHIAYVLLPCLVAKNELYVKVQVPAVSSEMNEKLVLISCHEEHGGTYGKE